MPLMHQDNGSVFPLVVIVMSLPTVSRAVSDIGLTPGNRELQQPVGLRTLFQEHKSEGVIAGTLHNWPPDLLLFQTGPGDLHLPHADRTRPCPRCLRRN